MESNSQIEKTVLIKKVSQGDEVAFRSLFNLYYQKLFHVALYFLKSKELAEEAVSDVFYTIWRKRDSLQEIKEMDNYLYMAVKNQALHYIRRSALPNNEPIDLYTIELLPESSTPEAKLLDKELTELIQRAINSLPEKCREVFRLVLSEKLKHKEISLLLNISEKTVEAHISIAYRRIAQYVNKEYSNKKTINRMLSFFF